MGCLITPTITARRPRMARIAAGLLCVAAAMPGIVPAQSYPSKPLRAIVPSGAGGPADTSARALAQALTPALGQPVVVENRPGANGILGMEACARAAADGYTVCVTQMAPVSINPLIYPKLSYDPVRDLAPVGLIGVTTGSIAVHASVPAKDLRELLALARARPGTLNWGSWGNASNSYLHLAWLQKAADVSFASISYKTPDQAVTALGTGEIQVLQNNPGIFLPMEKAGRIRVIAVSGARRSRQFPEIPTLSEQGFDLDFPGWNGVFAHAGTPGPVVARLNAELNRLLGDERFVQRFLAPAEIEPTPLTPSQTASFLQQHRRTAELLVKLANIRID